MRAYNFFASAPKLFTKFLSPNVGGVVVDHLSFPISDISISSGEIRDQTLKLSEFWTFLPSQILRWAASPKRCTQFIMPAARHVTWKFRKVASPDPKDVSAHRLNFGPIFKFIILQNCWGSPVFGKCGKQVLAILYHVRKFEGQHSLGAEI